eukprot:2879478-Rhodomonas_salina.1
MPDIDTSHDAGQPFFVDTAEKEASEGPQVRPPDLLHMCYAAYGPDAHVILLPGAISTRTESAEAQVRARLLGGSGVGAKFGGKEEDTKGAREDAETGVWRQGGLPDAEGFEGSIFFFLAPRWWDLAGAK